MSGRDLVVSMLDSMLVATERVERRFQGIESPDDFVLDDDGLDRLDGMRV